MQRKKLSVIAVTTLLAAVAGCEGPPIDSIDADDVSSTQAALEGENGLSWNGMSWNGLSWNGMSWNGLSWNGLAFNGLAFNGMAYNGLAFNGGLANPTVNQFVTYLVSCALPEDDSITYKIDGKRYKFEGDIGVAPEWKDDACDGECQRWMTACMLSRLNKKGEHVQISMRGDHEALKLERNEAREFPAREAAYFGNFFDSSSQIFACHSPGTPSIPRVCGDSLAGCPMKVVGSCDRVCEDTARDGSFRECDGRQKRDRVFAEVITVFLRE